MADLTARYVSVPVWNGEITMRVRVAGQGDPALYLHPAGGLFWDSFLERLSQSHTVYAPEHPGTTPGAEDAIGMCGWPPPCKGKITIRMLVACGHVSGLVDAVDTDRWPGWKPHRGVLIKATETRLRCRYQVFS